MRSSTGMGSPQGDRTMRDLSEQIRRDVQREVEQARAEARAAQAEARAAADEARAAEQAREGEGVAPPPGVPRIRVTQDGRAIVDVGVGEEPQLVASTQGPVPHPIPPIPVEAVVIAIAFFVMLAAIAIGVPLARAFARRMDRQGAQPAIPRELADQLLRLEQSVDTIAVEVERISEGQRFSSGLLRDLHPLVQRSQIAAPADPSGANGGR